MQFQMQVIIGIGIFANALDHLQIVYQVCTLLLEGTTSFSLFLLLFFFLYGTTNVATLLLKKCVDIHCTLNTFYWRNNYNQIFIYKYNLSHEKNQSTYNRRAINGTSCFENVGQFLFNNRNELLWEFFVVKRAYFVRPGKSKPQKIHFWSK